MSFRTTVILALLVGLLAAYAYFIEYKGTQKKEEEKEKQETLLEVKKEDVQEIRLEGIEGQTVVLSPESAEKWKITAPIQSRADESTVDRVLNQFEKLKYKEIIEEQPKDLAAYELDKPPLTIEFVLKGNTRKTIRIGAKNPINFVNYLQIQGDPRVYLVDGAVGNLTSTTLFELRDKKLTDFTAEKVESVSITTAESELLFEKQNGLWRMQHPVPSPASDSEVTSLLSSLELLRASKFVNPSDTEEDFGFSHPTATVELVLEKGLKQKILFGRKSESDIYCRVEGNPDIATVSDSFSVKFEQKIDEWREKKLVVFNRFDAEEARFKISDKEYAFQKDKEDRWQQLSPQKREIDLDAIQDILEQLESAEISRYGEQTSIDGAPSLEVSLTLKDWQDKITKKHILFGKVEDNLQQVKNDDYPTIILTHGALQKDLEKALSELKEKKPEPKEEDKEDDGE